MKILKAATFIDYITKGGSTMPWIVSAMDGDKEIAYVVKLFSPKTIEQQFAVGKEVFGNVLAKEFSLTVPDYALIDFGDDFIETLNDDHKQRLNKVDSGLKFGTVLKDGALNFSPALHKEHFKLEDFANVYAFDCLMYNVDRGRRIDKPNVLVNNEGFFLIDHEQSLHFADNQESHYNLIFNRFSEGRLDYPYTKHLFYNDLRSIDAFKKEHVFDEFIEYLTKMHTPKILAIGKSLSDNNISTGNYRRIFDYFCVLKRDINKVSKALISSIS